MPIDGDRWRAFLLNLYDAAEADGAEDPGRLAIDQYMRMRRAMWWAHWHLGLHAWTFRIDCHICRDLAEHVPANEPEDP